MTLRVPLVARFIGWFLLNLLIIGLVLVGALNLEFRLGPRSPLRAGRGQPLLSLARLITLELRHTVESSWNAILRRRAREYSVDLYLFSPDGKQLAGAPVRLPNELRKKMQRGPPPPVGLGGPAPGAAPVGPGGPAPGAAPVGPGGPSWFPAEPGTVAGAVAHPPPPAFSMRTSDPTRYWVAVAIPVFRGTDGVPSPGVLLVSSSSISGAGLFLDPRPVVTLVLLVVALSVLLWWPMVRHVTRPLARMTRATEQIASGRFGPSLEENRGDEIGRLSRGINEMSKRLATFVEGQKRFLGDIAHELSSPLARIQLSLGIMEQHVDTENRQRLDKLAEDVDQMSQLIDELLSFSRAEFGSSKIELREVSIADVVAETLQRERCEGVRIVCDIPPDLVGQADAALLTRALANLLRNAIRYAGDQGPIEISATRAHECVRIAICDSGPGVAPEHLGQLFDPFYRPTPARERTSGGVGLGLAIVKSCIEACKGTVRAHNRAPTGFCVTITLG
jgi:two-component system sensor histidine kinase CpxA